MDLSASDPNALNITINRNFQPHTEKKVKISLNNDQVQMGGRPLCSLNTFSKVKRQFVFGTLLL